MMESGETLLNNYWLGNRGSLSFLVRTISNVLVMEIGWTDVGSGGYILVSCAHSNTSYTYCLLIWTNFTYLIGLNYKKCYLYLIIVLYFRREKI